MLIVIRKVSSKGAWYRGMVGQTIEVEDEATTFSGVERYKVRGARAKFVRVDDAAPIRVGLVKFIERHEKMIAQDREEIKLLHSRHMPELVLRLISDKRELLEIIKVMTPIFETVLKNTVEKEGR